MKAKLFVTAFVALGLVACAGQVKVVDRDPKSGEVVQERTMDEDLYILERSQEHEAKIAETRSSLMQDCTSSNVANTEFPVCILSNVVTMLVTNQEATNESAKLFYADKANKRQFIQNLTLGLGTPFANAGANRLFYGPQGGMVAGGGSYTELNFGNRVAKGGGSPGEKSAASTSASGDTTFEDFKFSLGNKSPLNIGDGQYLTGKDSQYQTGDGVQGQAFTDPPVLNQPESNVNVDSGTGINLPSLPDK